MTRQRHDLVAIRLTLVYSLILFSCPGQEMAAPIGHEKRYCTSTVNFGAATTDTEPKFHCTHEDISYTYDENGRPFRKNNKRMSAAIVQRIDGAFESAGSGQLRGYYQSISMPSMIVSIHFRFGS